MNNPSPKTEPAKTMTRLRKSFLFYALASAMVIATKVGLRHFSNNSNASSICKAVQSAFQIGSHKNGLISARNMTRTQDIKYQLKRNGDVLFVSPNLQDYYSIDCEIEGRKDLNFSIFFANLFLSKQAQKEIGLLVVLVVLALVAIQTALSQVLQSFFREFNRQIQTHILNDSLIPAKSPTALNRIMDRILPHLTSLQHISSYTADLKNLLLRKEQDVLKAQEYKITSDLSRKIAHDIRSPLGMLDVLAKKQGPLEGKQKDLLLQVSNRINQAAENILESGKSMDGDIEKINLVTFLKNEIENKITENKSRQIQKTLSIVYQETDSDIIVTCNPSQLSACFSNFFNNSIEAGATKITVSPAQFENSVVVRISDNGQGIAKETLEQLGTTTLTTKPHGNGIGFFNSTMSIRSWGGQVSVKSEPGNGATVSITLPLIL